jgi:hypothetical protein
MKGESIQTYTVYIPENWESDLKTAIENNPPRFKAKKIQYDYFIYIGHIPHQTMWSKHKKTISMDEFMPISTRLLQERGVYVYKEYIQYLLDNNLLESDRHYIPGNKSKGYRYPVKYANEKPVKVVLTKKSLVKNLQKYRNSFSTKKDLQHDSTDRNKASKLDGSPSFTPTYAYLTKWFNENLKCDITKADEILLQLREEDLSRAINFQGEWVTLKKSKSEGGSRRHYKKFDPQARYHKRYSTALRIHEGSFDTNGVDTTTGRYHSPIVRLKKELRSTITYGGKRLVSVDIKNSQPFLLGVSIDPKVFINNSIGTRIYHYNPSVESYLRFKAFKKYDKDTYKLKEIVNKGVVVEGGKEGMKGGGVDLGYTMLVDFIKGNTKGLEDASYIMLVDFINERFQSKDVQEYLDWVTSGTFYENLGNVIAPTLKIEKHKTLRDAAKKATYSILFGRKGNNSKAVRAFNERFPSVAEIVALIKYGNPEEEYHRTLSCALQVFESDIVLNQCCRIISDERPDLPIFTVHDSIVTLQGEQEYVKSVMERTIKNLVGYTPKLDCQNW